MRGGVELLKGLASMSRRVGHFRGKGRLQRAVTNTVLRLAPGAPEVDLEVDGIRWRLDVGELIQFRIFWDGVHGANVIDWLCRELARVGRSSGPTSGAGGPVLWDIGSNIGAVALPVAARSPRARVECFEPSPRTHELLTANLARNVRLNAHAHALALSDTSGELPFYPSAERGNGGVGALYQASNTEVRPTMVRALRGDDAIASGIAAAPDVIKIDVEGFELEVLDGLRAHIAEHRPVMCVESSSYRLDERGLPRDAIVRELERLGYRLTRVLARGMESYERPLTRADLDENIDLAARPAG